MSFIMFSKFLKFSCMKVFSGKPSFIKKACNCRSFASGIEYKTKPYKLFKLEKGPHTKAKLSKEEAATYYRQMQMIRKIETASAALYLSSHIRGFCHLYSGQEAVAVGMKAALRPNDAAITSYRSHGWTYLYGVSPLGLLAEQTGRITGCHRGKGGSMHTYAKNFYGGNGIVGAQVPIGTGIAFALKYQNKDAICATLYGDGAADQGQVFESFNIAALWKLPILFVCENNGYSMGTKVPRHSANQQYYSQGGYIPGIWVDGMDVLTVREATKFGIDYCSKNGPLIIEAATYRYYGHSLSDPGTSYRTREEIQEVRKKRDPITAFTKLIKSAGLLSDEELKKIDSETKKEVDEATEKSKKDAVPNLDELTTDVYANNLEPTIRNCTPFKPLQHKRVGKTIGQN